MEIVDLWHAMFEDDDVLLVATAVKALISSDDKGFPPVIGAVKKKMRDLVTQDAMTEIEAWNHVRVALRDSLYNSKTEYDKLSPTIQRTLGNSTVLREWAMMGLRELETVIKSNFLRSYKSIAEQEKEVLSLPTAVREFSKQIEMGRISK